MAQGFVLRGLVTLNDSLFNAGMRRVVRTGTAYARKIGTNLKGFITSPLAAAGAAIAGFITYQTFKAGIGGAIKLGEELYEMSARTGVAVDQLYILKRTAADVGLEFDGLAPAIGRMQRFIVNAARGSAMASSAIRYLGLNVSQLAKETPIEQFREIGVSINALPDPALRAAMAMKIFGRSGTEMLPLFREMSDADFGEMTAKAKAMRENAQLFHQITVNFRRAGANLRGIFLGIAIGIGPMILSMQQTLNKIDWFSLGQKIGQTLGHGLMYVDKVFQTIGGAWSSIFGDASTQTVPIFDAFKASFESLWDYAQAGFMTFINFVVNGFRNGIMTIVEAMLSGLKWVLDQMGGTKLGDLLGVDDMARSLGVAIDKMKESHKNDGPFDPDDIAKTFAKAANESVVSNALFDSMGKAFKDAWALANAPDTERVTVSGRAPYKSPLETGRGGLISGGVGGIEGGDLGGGENVTADAPRWLPVNGRFAMFPHGGSRLAHGAASGFKGPLSSGAFGQTGGMGSLSNAQFNNLTEDEQAKALLSPAERAQYENQMVAHGGTRAGTTEGAYGAVASGDKERREAVLKSQLIAKQGIDKSNELLDGIYSRQGEMLEEWKGGQ